MLFLRPRRRSWRGAATQDLMEADAQYEWFELQRQRVILSEGIQYVTRQA